MHLLRGEAEPAEQCFAEALAKSTVPQRWSFQNGLSRARIKAGKVTARYLELGPGTRTFQDLAWLCVQDKNAAQLESLLAAHRQGQSDKEEMLAWDVEVCWLKKDYDGALKLLQEHREVLSSPRHQWKYENHLIRCLVKLKRSEEALQQAEAIAKRKSGNRVLVVLAHASLGDAKKLLAAVAQLGHSRYLLEDCYRDDDLGPLLRSEAFREFRARFPEPPARLGPGGRDPYDD
jgi:hypothetical protein